MPADPIRQPVSLSHDEQCERAVLGGLLIEPQRVAELSNRLVGSDFHERRNQIIFRRMQQLADEEVTIEILSLRAALEQHGELEEVGGIAYLSALDTDFNDLSQFDQWVDIIWERAQRRRLDEVFEAAQRGITQGEPIATVVGPVNAAIDTALRETSNGIVAYEAEDFLALRKRRRKWLAEPVIREKDLVMIYGPRGVGKTRFVHELAVGVASGTDVLRWSVNEATGVLVVDGEMQTEDLQERIAATLKAKGSKLAAPLRVIAADAQERGLPNLATREGQAAIERYLDGIQLVILDNVSTLFDSGPENDAESWSPIQDWLLRLRRQGFAVVLVHHSGKGGQQRGTSRREDVLDLVLNLRHPKNYHPSEGARFEIHFEKARGLTGDAVQAVEVSLIEDQEGRAMWTTKIVNRATSDRVAELADLGMCQREIAKELDLHQSTVSRALRRHREGGS